MSSVNRKSFNPGAESVSDDQMRKAMEQVKWQTVQVHISKDDLKENFKFLNDAVVVRGGREGVPYLSTTGIFGPINPGSRVKLTPGEGTGVAVLDNDPKDSSLIKELQDLFKNTTTVDDDCAATVNARWLSAKDGGAIPDLGNSSNVFGQTGSLFVNESAVSLPVLDPLDERYAKTLAYYGARLLKPKEEFTLGFDAPLFGMEYDTKLPEYLTGYVNQPYGGGGLFVEFHPFPHIWLPRPNDGSTSFTQSKITLGREASISTREKPVFHFTSFRVPSDGTALALMPNSIHNDSYTNGPQTVFLANTPADTVAWRETAAFTSILLTDVTFS